MVNFIELTKSEVVKKNQIDLIISNTKSLVQGATVLRNEPNKTLHKSRNEKQS